MCSISGAALDADMILAATKISQWAGARVAVKLWRRLTEELSI